ncbi:MAG: hypothetical protein HY236_01605 [Acidobacteria bacterium]|nr:hypothetical protein [Acidobacteriota bacterium]
MRLRRGACVLVAAFVLFPCVSASDDMAWSRTLSFPTESGGGAGTPLPGKSDEKPTLHLARLLEALGSFQVAIFYSLCLTLCFFSLFRSAIRLSHERYLTPSVGRAPPVSAVLG